MLFHFQAKHVHHAFLKILFFYNIPAAPVTTWNAINC